MISYARVLVIKNCGIYLQSVITSTVALSPFIYCDFSVSHFLSAVEIQPVFNRLC